MCIRDSPFCQTDYITLKTIIRSNPGLLLVKDGTILNKWSDNRLPDESVLTDSLDKLELGKQKQESDLQTIGYVSVSYTHLCWLHDHRKTKSYIVHG